MRSFYTCMRLAAILLSYACFTQFLSAQTPNEIYQRRVIPLLQSSKASSCSQCHLQGVKLDEFLTSDPLASFASLRARGWIDVESPDSSKLLQFIAKRPEPGQLDYAGNDSLIDQVRSAELDAIGQWIRACVNDPEALRAPLPAINDLKLDEALIEHSRSDAVLGRFVDVIWSQLERCANCHSPERNAKQVQKNGEQMSWIVPNSPAATIRLLDERGLIDLEHPELSSLRTKALGRDDHGGGVKFPLEGQTDREWVAFLNDYAAVKRGTYLNSSAIPATQSVRTWRTGLHLKLLNIPNVQAGQYAVVLLHRVDADSSVDSDVVAFGEGRVGKDGSSWGTTLTVLLTGQQSPSALDDWQSLMNIGRYRMMWMVVDDSRTPLKKILTMRPTEKFELDSLWQPGHGNAKQISFENFAPY